ncbi:hypothetical protein DICVIV_05936 [Dictyocaulus viviparus]|uniref:Calponin-homology (CH) domain-containing protein n=1 Tax=Dictyocaulus viviparus TaxID=29172 RepID=A0A0D8XTV8_DICVI|nr:hypothetical protein DICVIV_05936 [Dictyocaulus viviparus]
MTRAIGYPRILSIENFRTPNFKLVAELLEWIVKRFDANVTLSAEQTATEKDRVLFIKQAVLLLLQKARLRLNPRKLYQLQCVNGKLTITAQLVEYYRAVLSENTALGKL